MQNETLNSRTIFWQVFFCFTRNYIFTQGWRSK